MVELHAVQNVVVKIDVSGIMSLRVLLPTLGDWS